MTTMNDTPLPLRVRALAADDSIDALTALLHRAYAPLGAMGLNYTAVDQTVDVTRSRLAGGMALVAEWGGALVGTVVVKPTAPGSDCAWYRRAGVASVQQFAVDPARQGGGIGRTLLAEAERLARDSGHAELALDTAEPATHLVRLYTGLGYRHVGHVQWPGKAYRSVVLSKPLAGAPMPTAKEDAA